MAIFDFDGTIVDSLEQVVSAYNQVAPLLRVHPVDPAELPRLRTLDARSALRAQHIALWKLPLVVRAVRVALRGQADALEPFDGMVSLLQALPAAGCACAIVSTNAPRTIARFLAQHGLTQVDPVVGNVRMFGKARALRRLLRGARLDPAQAYYVGDEVRDVRAAARAGIASVAVGWGYADRSALARESPSHLVDRPDQLLALLTGRAAPA
jgi:phosphoglycolate phosphatase